MELLDLPSEVLILIYKSVADVRDLHHLTRTCSYAREIYVRNSVSITDSILDNAYKHLAPAVSNIVDAIHSLGELDYVYVPTPDWRVEWILPEACKASRQSEIDENLIWSRLRTLTNLVDSTESLADWCIPTCMEKSSWRTPEDVSLRENIVDILFRLQLVTNRLYNVRLPSFPEHMSLRAHEKDRMGSPISRRARHQTLDLMKDELQTLELRDLKNMWILLQVLQDEYLLLRRHRLRPVLGSLLDLLFQHDASDHGWRISPWFTVQALLSGMGVHVVPARPGTVFRFLGNEPTHDLHQRDLGDFDAFVTAKREEEDGGAAAGLANPRGSCAICAICRPSSDTVFCPHDYLERFRPLIGLPHADSTPVKTMVRFSHSLSPVIVANASWSFDSLHDADHSALGRMLWECAEHNRNVVGASAKRRSSLKSIGS